VLVRSINEKKKFEEKLLYMTSICNFRDHLDIKQYNEDLLNTNINLKREIKANDDEQEYKKRTLKALQEEIADLRFSREPLKASVVGEEPEQEPVKEKPQM
jgi:hypothetical protein